VPPANGDRQRDRPEDADRLAAALLVRIEPLPFAVDADQLALRDQALADGGIEVGEHGGAL
jgi:CO/xanthine dehydrogenase Mo-binding subunit